MCFAGGGTTMEKGNTLKDADTEIVAEQFSSPITVWINMCSRINVSDKTPRHFIYIEYGIIKETQ